MKMVQHKGSLLLVCAMTWKISSWTTKTLMSLHLLLWPGNILGYQQCTRLVAGKTFQISCWQGQNAVILHAQRLHMSMLNSCLTVEKAPAR